MPELELFQAERPRLFSVAYRMLGSASEAEDVLQDAWVRLAHAETVDVRSPQAYATTVVTRLCLDRLKSARARREEYVGPWLPEPVLTRDEEAPDVVAERSESVTLAFLLLLETLTAEERAVFLLKEVFDYGHAEIAAMLGTTPANSRQLFHRAKAKLRKAPPRPEAATGNEPRLAVAARFAEAFRSGDAAKLAQLLAEDVALVADGGGKAAAARRPVEGRDAVLALLVGVVRAAEATGIASRATIDVAEVNAEPALVLRVDGRLDGVYVLSVEEGAIADIRIVRNPDKLAYLERQLAGAGARGRPPRGLRHRATERTVGLGHGRRRREAMRATATIGTRQSDVGGRAVQVAQRYLVPAALGLLLALLKIVCSFFGGPIFFGVDVVVFGGASALLARRRAQPWWEGATLIAGPAFLWTVFVLALLGPGQLARGVGSFWLVSLVLLPLSAWTGAYLVHRRSGAAR